jgi:hypothetical protein
MKNALEEWKDIPSNFDVDNCQPTKLGVYSSIELKFFPFCLSLHKYSKAIQFIVTKYIITKQILHNELYKNPSHYIERKIIIISKCFPWLECLIFGKLEYYVGVIIELHLNVFSHWKDKWPWWKRFVNNN